MITFAQIAKLYNELSEEVKQKHSCLQKWSFVWNHRLTNAMGRAVRSNKKGFKIELSSKLVALNLTTPNFLDRVKETIIHEWAHALDWEMHKGWGHGPTWRKCMMSFGYVPERCYDGKMFLSHPKGASHAIRNNATGRIWGYLRTYPSPAELTKAHHWHRVQLMRPAREELELVNLNTGSLQIIP
jgi:predicted SprT family Zn-dependent metalloprotease